MIKTILKKGNIDVAKVDIYPACFYPFVSKIEILSPENMPFDITELMKIEDEEEKDNRLRAALMIWFECRAIPNGRKNLDYFIMNLLGLEYHRCGRMYGYQAFIALLSYYLSADDDYYITPEKAEYVSIYDICPNTPGEYLWLPVNYERVCEIKAHPDPEIRKYLGVLATVYKKMEPYDYKGCFPTMDFTIQSREPAYWDVKDGKRELVTINIPY